MISFALSLLGMLLLIIISFLSGFVACVYIVYVGVEKKLKPLDDSEREFIKKVFDIK